MTPPEKKLVRRVGKLTLYERRLPSADIPASLAERERLRQSLLADAGGGDLLKTIIERVAAMPVVRKAV
jgi:hypothetical protein